MAKGQTMLLLGVYGAEMVECGGVLAKNVRDGGKSYASIMLSSKQYQPQVKNAADVLGVDVRFLDFTPGEVGLSTEEKLAIIKIIRETKPDIIICQDPDHVVSDLDPDRRMAMTLILESIALASRQYGIETMKEYEPHPIPSIYYLWPEKANCVVDIADVWNLKEESLNCLEYQLAFCAAHYEKQYNKQTLEALVPNWYDIKDQTERGRLARQQLDKAHYMSVGGGHSNFVFAEGYRKEGLFHLDNLLSDK